MKEGRFAMLARSKPEESNRLLELGQDDIDARWKFYEELAHVTRVASRVADAGDGPNRAHTAEKVNA